MIHPYEYTLPELKKRYTEAGFQIQRYKKESDSLLRYKPAPNTWSALEVCRHLCIFGALYLEQIDKAVAKKSPVPQSEGPFRPRWHFRKLAAFFEPPYKIKTKTLPVFVPPESPESGNPDEVLDTLADIQANALYILDKAEAELWNLQKIKGKNPALGILSMSLIEFLVLMEVHQRRHFWQIERILESAKEKEIR